MAFWRDSFTIEEINFVLDHIRPTRQFSPTGSVSIQGFLETDDWVSVLVSAINLDVKSNAIRHEIVKGALFSMELPIDFSEADFRAVIHKRKQLLQSTNLKHYRVVFPIWNQPRFLTGVRKVNDVTLNFSPSPRTKVARMISRERNQQQTDRGFGNPP